MTLRRRSVAFLVWRDTRHPEGGGSELYVERVAAGLAGDGWDVTVACAAYPGGARDEVRDGVRFRRRGGRLTVYLHGLAFLVGRGRRTDVVVDVQNGLPFFSPLVRRRPIVALVHHVHREQWQIIYPGAAGRIGWWLESRLAPRFYRHRRYITVSDASRADLVGLGIDADRITVVHNGLDLPPDHGRAARADTPTICVLGRLVPHKQVDHALRTVAAVRTHVPDVHLDIVGDGWWRPQLETLADALAVTDLVTFHGAVSDAERDALLDRAWVLLAPSVKEGWGLSIMEAAAHGVPAIAYRSAGGVRDSIVDGDTGWLVEGFDGLTKRTEELLTDTPLREAMGRHAASRAAGFDWAETTRRIETVLHAELEPERR